MTWENQEDGEVEGRVSDWEAEGEDAVTEAGESEGESGEGGIFNEGGGEEEEGYVEPPEEAKIFVGNLPYDVDSENLAMLFEKAGTVEIAEVRFFPLCWCIKFAFFFFWVAMAVNIGVFDVWLGRFLTWLVVVVGYLQ